MDAPVLLSMVYAYPPTNVGVTAPCASLMAICHHLSPPSAPRPVVPNVYSVLDT